MPSAATGALGSLQAVQAAHLNPQPQQAAAQLVGGSAASGAAQQQRDFMAGNSNSSSSMLALQQLLASQLQQTGGGLQHTNGTAGMARGVPIGQKSVALCI